jgi:hypothetical protein
MDEILFGDCLDLLRTLPDNSVGAIVTDPPYGLGTREPSPEQLAAYLRGASLDTGGDFMGKKWKIPSVAIWREGYRVLQPGRHILSFAGTRTWDIVLAGMEAAGFIRQGALGEPFGSPLLSWIHGQGFPKCGYISKVIDKHLGVEPTVIGERTMVQGGGTALQLRMGDRREVQVAVTTATSPEAKKWEGWGVALKPAWEPIIALRKPGPMPKGLPPLLLPFLYCPKVTAAEANAGIDKRLVALGMSDLEKNTHPTRKPITLMKWLIKVTARMPEMVLDPFCGSGSTGVAAVLLGNAFLGIERDPMYREIAAKRLAHAHNMSMAEARDVFAMLMDDD